MTKRRTRLSRAPMQRKVKWLFVICIIGAAAYGGSVLATPNVAASTPSAAHAGHDHAGHGHARKHHAQLALVRLLTARFHRVENAVKAGYELGYVNGAGNRIITGCIAHPTDGAMGYHYFHKQRIDDLVANELKPEGLVYAPGANGRIQARRRRVRRAGRELQPSRGFRGTEGLRNGDGDPGAGGGLLHAACVGLASQPGGDVRALESEHHLPLVGNP